MVFLKSVDEESIFKQFKADAFAGCRQIIATARQLV